VLLGGMIFAEKRMANTRNEKDFAEGINTIRASSYSVHMICAWCGSATRV
jgi:hypothetical protein